MPTGAPRVVIVGGGFAGLQAARALDGAPFEVTLIDRRNHHVFQPLLYQVATAALNPSDIAAPLRQILRRQKNLRVVLGEVSGVDLAARRLTHSGGTLEYDTLIIATGATHSYFGHDEWAKHAPGLKTLEDAIDIRRRVLVAYERAELESDEARRAAWLTFVVVGGGPTGVELAGSLAEISRHTLSGEFTFDPARARVLLVEAAPRVLGAYPEDLSEKAKIQLERLGVEVKLGAAVTELAADHVQLGGERIDARTVLWAAGVRASPLAQALSAKLDRAGRVCVEPDLSIAGHPEVFVLGDLASVAVDAKTVPGVAPAAMQEGRYVGKLLRARARGETIAPFRYQDKGSLATIGRAAGVASFGRVHLAGFIAWWAWLTIHLYFLIGFRNRLIVLFDWAWAYVTYQRGARLITGETSTGEHK
jgi:NADH dehydrogenase